jgi:hypothetical protein
MEKTVFGERMEGWKVKPGAGRPAPLPNYSVTPARRHHFEPVLGRSVSSNSTPNGQIWVVGSGGVCV